MAGRSTGQDRWAALAAGVAVISVVLSGCSGRTPAASTATAGTRPAGTSGTATQAPVRSWLSGAASDQSASGQFGAWRGSPIQIGGTWDNGDEAQVAMATICPGGSWARWNKPLDVAIGAIDVDRGESWAAAAEGAYDQRWRQNLQRIKQCWGGRDPGLLYIRFAHEMNLASMAWRVQGGEEPAFVRAITRYSTLRYQILPAAKIVLCPNDGSSPSLDVDIRKLWPGRDAQGRLVADVYAVDSYNTDPHATTAAEVVAKFNGQADDGTPEGIEKHRQFAQRVGVPFAISEWGNNGDTDGGDGGESPVYVQQFHAWAAAHAGDPSHPKPGQLLYEVQFNLWTQYEFWPTTIQPKTAAAYRALSWGITGR